MKRRYPKTRPSKAARDAYRRLMRGDDDCSRLEKGIDLVTLPELAHPDTKEEPTP